jgi:hypothetical protein
MPAPFSHRELFQLTAVCLERLIDDRSVTRAQRRDAIRAIHSRCYAVLVDDLSEAVTGEEEIEPVA